MYDLVKAALFRLDAEAAHDFVATQIARTQAVPRLIEVLTRAMQPDRLTRRVWGIDFENPLGIAAGFDKNAEMMPFLRAIGFGFIEVGTITLRPQSGNPRPRMFRYPEHRALVNRLGFNNNGAHAAARRLEDDWNDAATRAVRMSRPLLANIGKNRDVSIADAADNYAACYRIVAPWVDGVVVNVSSPNTAGLRDLQRPEHLEALLGVLRAERDSARFVRTEGIHPIILKIAPDLDDAQLGEIADVAAKLADGLTATNTTVDRSLLGPGLVEPGGISGAPLFESSTGVLRKLRHMVGPEYPIIGVGGIFDGEDAAQKLEAGATLVQVYTGFIYGGPGLPGRIVRHIGERR